MSDEVVAYAVVVPRPVPLKWAHLVYPPSTYRFADDGPRPLGPVIPMTRKQLDSLKEAA